MPMDILHLFTTKNGRVAVDGNGRRLETPEDSVCWRAARLWKAAQCCCGTGSRIRIFRRQPVGNAPACETLYRGARHEHGGERWRAAWRGRGPFSIESSFLGRALRAGITDRIQHIADRSDRLVRRDTGRRSAADGDKSTLAGMRVGAVPHPAVLLAFADGADLDQNRPRPSFDRAERERPFLHHQHRNRSCSTGDESFRHVPRSALLTHGRDSEWWGRGFSTCSTVPQSGHRVSEVFAPVEARPDLLRIKSRLNAIEFKLALHNAKMLAALLGQCEQRNVFACVWHPVSYFTNGSSRLR